MRRVRSFDPDCECNRHESVSEFEDSTYFFVVERIHLVKIGCSGHVDMFLPLGPRGRDLQRTAG